MDADFRTALCEPPRGLEQQILDATPAIERRFRNQWQAHEAPFYSAGDLHDGALKIAPVDTKIFREGFNNLNPGFLPLPAIARPAIVKAPSELETMAEAS
jgi:glutamate--cysteine ligase